MSSSMRDIDDSILYLEEEEILLKKSLSIREKIIDKIIEKEGIPTDNRTIRVVNELLNSIDNQILGKVDRRLKKKDIDDNSKIRDNIVELLSKVTINDTGESISEVEGELNDEDIVEGELDISTREHNVKEMIEKG